MLLAIFLSNSGFFQSICFIGFPKINIYWKINNQPRSSQDWCWIYYNFGTVLSSWYWHLTNNEIYHPLPPLCSKSIRHAKKHHVNPSRLSHGRRVCGATVNIFCIIPLNCRLFILRRMWIKSLLTVRFLWFKKAK